MPNWRRAARCYLSRQVIRASIDGFHRPRSERYLRGPNSPWMAACWFAVVKAGGVAVVAHPGRYRISNGALRRFLGQFKDAGGEGVEVVSGSHGPDQMLNFARIARHYGFLASRGSDFHGPEESYTDLGCLPPLPEDLTPVWSRF